MGQFSWLDCKTGEQILDDVCRDVYLLRPIEFGGGHIEEHCYDGYGRFGGYDVYDLVAEWNRKFISDNPNYETYSHGKVGERPWYKYYTDMSKTPEEIVECVRKEIGSDYFEWRFIGIEIACYDEDNANIKYPIKITHTFGACYEDCNPSLGDPNQGWRY